MPIRSADIAATAGQNSFTAFADLLCAGSARDIPDQDVATAKIDPSIRDGFLYGVARIYVISV